MAYRCPQCPFTAQFESALIMHRQLHHDCPDDYPVLDKPNMLPEKSHTLPRMSPPLSPCFTHKNKGIKLPYTSSATKLFDKLKARISKSRTALFAHAEEPQSSGVNLQNLKQIKSTAKQSKIEVLSRGSALTTCLEDCREIFPCHLCSFDADRITVLDRHLLNDHKISLDNLLKLVMAKTRDGLAEDQTTTSYGIRQPYYKPEDEIIEEGEFIIETVTPKIKILRHASTNTEDTVVENDFKMITKEIETLLSGDKNDGDLMSKMQTLNECMCKFFQSSKVLKKVLNKEFDWKAKEQTIGGEFNNMGSGESTPRDWQRAHSENMERNRSKYGDSARGNKPKTPSDSFYF